MSWSVRPSDASGSAQAVRVVMLDSTLDMALVDAKERGWIPEDQSLIEEFVRETWPAAKAAAYAIATSRALGGADLVYVSLSGHVNPLHAPRDGWSDDTVTVTVTQARPDATVYGQES